MVEQQQNCFIPTELIPVCPVCGGNMEPNIRIDSRFVEDDTLKLSNSAYEHFLNESVDKKLLLIEAGVGYNTPGIIKYPFEQITAQSELTTLVRMNQSHPEATEVNRRKSIAFDEDIGLILEGLNVT